MSGGPDSVAMLLLFHEVAPRNFCVATVDHGLRPESADEAVMVAALCAERSIPHRTLALSLAKGSGVQARARAARYAALVQWARTEGLGAIATAHHADDQAETMVMRLNRGAGLRGLAGMRAISIVPDSPDIALVRPLLSWSRRELRAVVEAAGVAAADDPSNRDATYERVRVRGVMTSTDVFDAKGFTASARHLADADVALEWMVRKLCTDIDREPGVLIWWAPDDLPDVVALRMLERILDELGTSAPRGDELVRLLGALRAGGVATLAGVKGDARKGPWRFTLAPKHRH